MSTSAAEHDIIHGWVQPNSGRGTFDILTTCVLTIFLCCWTSICVNIPAPTETRRQRFLDKVKLAGVGILGPDFLCIIAIGQYESARRSVRVRTCPLIFEWIGAKGVTICRISIKRVTIIGPCDMPSSLIWGVSCFRLRMRMSLNH